MAEGKQIQFRAGEYPELDGLESGSTVKLDGTASVEVDGEGNGTLTIQTMEFQTEGVADRELRDMRGQAAAGSPKRDYSEDF